MDNEKFQELILKKLEILDTLNSAVSNLSSDVSGLKEDVSGLKEDVSGLKEGQKEIKTELRGIWDDILRLDKRLSAQDEELVIMRRLK